MRIRAPAAVQLLPRVTLPAAPGRDAETKTGQPLLSVPDMQA
ncbi:MULTISPECIES: hypothetical protein [Streptomyces]|nr:hypothetical protein [Streptomyces spinosisporus]